MKAPILAACAVAALGLAACATSPVQTQNYVAPTYDFGNFRNYHQGRDTRVVVYGDPFKIPKQRFDRIVTGLMQGYNSGGPTNFTTQPGPSAEPNLRVVMAFDAAPQYGDLCSANAFSPAPGGERLTLTAAWCWGDRLDSRVEGSAPPVSGPNDPAFAELVHQVTFELFPPNGYKRFYNEDDGNDDPFP